MPIDSLVVQPQRRRREAASPPPTAREKGRIVYNGSYIEEDSSIERNAFQYSFNKANTAKGKTSSFNSSISQQQSCFPFPPAPASAE